jgi:hypothetical protein
MTVTRRRFWTLAVRQSERFVPEFGSFVRGEAIAAMSDWRRRGVRRANLKIVGSDPDPAAIEKAVEALNTGPGKIFVVDTGG